MMRSKVDAKAFVQALDKVSNLIRKSYIPILNGVLVQFGPDRCTLTSTNLESWLSVRLPAQGDSFACLLGRPRETARAFRQFDGELALEETETGEGVKRRLKLALSCGPRSAELPAFLPEDFPEQQAWEPRHSFSANAAHLYERVERVKYATGVPSKSEARACMVSVQFDGNRVYAVDGYRLAWDTDPGLSVPVPFMAAPDALEHLKLFGDQTVDLRLGERFAEVTDGAMSLQFRLPEGSLLKLDNAIPERFQAEFQLSPQEFLAELIYLKRALPGKGPYKVRFSGGSLFAENLGERFATKISVSGCERVEFGFNLDYMADALGQFKQAPFVKMKVSSGSVGPIVIETEGRSDYALVLPVRLRETVKAA